MKKMILIITTLCSLGLTSAQADQSLKEVKSTTHNSMDKKEVIKKESMSDQGDKMKGDKMKDDMNKKTSKMK